MADHGNTHDDSGVTLPKPLKPMGPVLQRKWNAPKNTLREPSSSKDDSDLTRDLIARIPNQPTGKT